MAGNSFGQLFRITTFGESHGVAVGVVIDGCPAGLKLSEKDVQVELDRRRPGQSSIVSPRDEKDSVMIYSGIFNGKTTGAPIMMMVFNENVRSQDYEKMKDLFRPSHADFTYQMKYGLRDYRGGGRSSARETLARVAAGAVAKKFLKSKGVEFLSFVEQVGNVAADIDYSKVKMKDIEASEVRCPDARAAKKMIELIKKLRAKGDTIGGVIFGCVRGVPVGLGEPVFDKLHADLGKAMLSINAVKGFEIGSGFAGTLMKGSEHNDPFVVRGGKMHVSKNDSGGVLGGISTGEDIYFRVAFKPVATIMMEQKTVDVRGKAAKIRAFGRHDACVLPRAVPIVDSMAALVMMDHYLRVSVK